MPDLPPLIAVDIGNSFTKFGVFAPDLADVIPRPRACLQFSTDRLDREELSRRLPWKGARWCVAAVRGAAARKLERWIHDDWGGADVLKLRYGNLPLRLNLARPDNVGIDRLLGALAADRMRPTDHAAVVVDMGTAVTVNLLGRDGTFLGGSIFPGPRIAGLVLGQQTEKLPVVPFEPMPSPPPVLGNDTTPAIVSGLYWGTVGGIREITAGLAALVGEPVRRFLTGGAAPSFVSTLGSSYVHEPDLKLIGAAIAAREACGV